MGKTRDFFKKIGRYNFMVSLLCPEMGRNSRDLTEAEEIKRVVRIYRTIQIRF